MRIAVVTGSGEAREAALALGGAGFSVVGLSVAEARGGWPEEVPLVPCSAGEVAAVLAREGAGAVLDAGHPFAAELSERVRQGCAAAGLPYLRLLRPAWKAPDGADWHEVASEAEVGSVIATGARVFVATGRDHLDDFAELAGRAELLVRQITPPGRAFPFDRGKFVVDAPPFTLDAEREMLRDRGIDVLVMRNVGGTGSRPKLDAALVLGLRVVLIARPDLPGPQVGTVDAAVAWARGLA